ncbi:MAG: hypothetical protein EXS35_09445 [Pedosphaera sp.]|nr:hypothetical protein [Pedosphaera sp.]
MKAISVNAILLISIVAITLVGCKKEEKVDATKPLEQSFATATPEVKQSIQAVNANLKSGNVMEAAKQLDPVLNTPNLTEQQKQAVALTLKQVNDAIAANPALDSKEMYELRKKMFFKVYGQGH